MFILGFIGLPETLGKQITVAIPEPAHSLDGGVLSRFHFGRRRPASDVRRSAGFSIRDITTAPWSNKNMKKLLMIALVAAAILGAGCSTVPQSDTTALQGRWKGKDSGGSGEGLCCLTISGNTIEFRAADTNEWYKGTFTLRQDTNPKQLVAVVSECPAPQYIGKTAYAIYRLEAGRLTLTGNEPGKNEVPSGFDAPGSRKLVLGKP